MIKTNSSNKKLIMSTLKKLGKVLSKEEQKSINGAMHQGAIYACIDRFPFVYYVSPGQSCDDGSAPLCP